MKNNKMKNIMTIVIIIIMIGGGLMMWEARNGFPPN